MTCEQLQNELEFYVEEESVRIGRVWLNWWSMLWFMSGFWHNCRG